MAILENGCHGWHLTNPECLQSLKWPLWCLVWVCQVSCFYHKVHDFSVICWTTTSCRCVFPLANIHLPGATLNACSYERLLAEANANRNTVFMVHHFGGMTSSEDSPQHHRRMRMAVSVMIKAQDEGPTWTWFCVAPDISTGKLWWVAWCAGRLLDHTPNDVAQKPQTCDVILSSMGEVRLWRGASYKCWNDDFWLETRAIFSTYRRTQILPNGIHTLGVMIHVGTLTSCM